MLGRTRLNILLPETEVHLTYEVPTSRELRVPSRPFLCPTAGVILVKEYALSHSWRT